MKNYHMQVKYTNEWFSIEGHIGSNKVDVLLDWTNIEEAPNFETMQNRFENSEKIFHQSIRMISDDGEAFYIGHNVANNYPHRINHLH